MRDRRRRKTIVRAAITNVTTTAALAAHHTRISILTIGYSPRCKQVPHLRCVSSARQCGVPVVPFMKAGGVGSWFFWSEQSNVAHDAVVPARVAGPPSWLIGFVVGIAALSVVGRDIALFTLALFTSLSGIACRRHRRDDYAR